MRTTLLTLALLALTAAGARAQSGATPIACDTNAQALAGDPGAQFLVACPEGCAAAPAWGTNIYTDDSSICTAAVHAGVLAPGRPGEVRVTIAPGLPHYPPVLRSGVSTAEWNEWGRSFFVTNPAATEAVAVGGSYALTFGCPACWVALFTPDGYRDAMAGAAACHPHPDYYNHQQADMLQSLMWIRPNDPCLGRYVPPRQGMQTEYVAPGRYVAVAVREGYRAVQEVEVVDRAVTADLESRLEFFDCGFSCPIVYVRSGGELVRVGEILTDLRSADLEATQAVLLPAPDRVGDVVSVRLAEEEPELSYVDRVVLRAGERELLPALCAGEPEHALCADDGVYTNLDMGQSLDLTFDVAGVAPDAAFELVVKGYYLPLGVADSSR